MSENKRANKKILLDPLVAASAVLAFGPERIQPRRTATQENLLFLIVLDEPFLTWQKMTLCSLL